MKRRKFLKNIALGSVSLAATSALFNCAVPMTKKNRPNILFIASDDLRPMLGCYGNPYIKTPNIDKLASGGTVFMKNYCQYPLCGPTRSSLLTGLRPDATQIFGNSTHIREAVPDVITLPQHFRQQGYHTVNYGKMYHDRNVDDSLSWSEPGLHVEGRHFGDYNNPETLKMLEETEGEDPTMESIAPPTDSADVPDNAYSDGQFADMAIQAMERLKRGTNPFFLSVGFVRPHLPFNCPQKYWDMYDPDQIPLAPNRELPEYFPTIPVYNSWWMRHFKGMPAEGPFPEDVSRHLNHAYAACVSFVDAQVGRLLDALKENGLEQNTIVCLWGDHGYLLGDHGIYGKHTNFEKAVHSPMIIRAPGYQDAQTVDGLTEFVDIYPSLCELAGLTVPDHVQGTSFVPIMKDPGRPWKNGAFSQYLAGSLMGYSVRTKKYRYTEWIHQDTHEIEASELYDYQQDPHEKINLSVLESHEYLVKELSDQLRAGWESALPAS